MTRLVISHKEKIVKSAIDAKFEPLAHALYREMAGLAFACYNELYPPLVLNNMTRLPEGWLPKQGHLTFQFGPAVIRLSFNGFDYGYFKLGDYRLENETKLRVQSRHTGGVCAVYEEGSPMDNEYTALVNKRKAWEEQRSTATKLTAATLDKFTTVEKLLEAWPEIEHHVLSTEPDLIQPKLPAIPLMQLNTLLDLPPETAA